MPEQPTEQRRLQWLTLIQRYFEQDLGEQELRDYNALLRESEAFRQLFVDYSRQCSAMHEVLETHSVCTPRLDDSTDLNLSFQAAAELLARGSENAQLVHLHGELKPHQRLMPYLIGGAIAAVLALAVTLTFVFSGGTTPSQEPGFSFDTLPANENTVATLTAVSNAKWAEGALAPGSDLQSNQKLTLIQGSATLTTNKGGVATLFAPCSIKLIDDNALHLTHGRLSGRVDSKRAQGFAVHLPTGDKVVDLGTAFTVAVDDAGRPDVRVTEGLVAWVPKPSAADRTPAKPLLIAANQSAALVAGRPVLTRADRLLGIDFQHTGAKTVGPGLPTAGVTQPGFEAFDQTRFAEGNRAAFATDAGEITLALAGLDIDQHDGYFTRLPTPDEDPFPGFDLYNDFVFENNDGRFTLTLAGPAITPGQAYDLTFYAYDPGRAEDKSSSHGRVQSIAFTGIDGTAGQAGPITYTVGTHPTRIDQFKTTAAFTADAQGRITIEATDAFEDNEQCIRLSAIEIARRVAPNNITTN